LNESCPSQRIALIVDNPRRDLRGLVLLAYQLARRGAEVFLVPMYQQGYDLPLLAPDLVVLNYARESNRGLMESYRDLRIRVAVLDTEGGVLSESGFDSPNNWAASFRNSNLADLVDDHCFWGQAVFDAFREHSGMDGDALALTGCPRYDVCNQPWASLLNYSRSGFILVNTNFSSINPAFTRSDADEQRILRELGWDESYIQKWFAELHKVFPRYLDVIEAIAQAAPDRMVQVRPHPFENEALYRERFDGIPNVIIDGKGDVFNAIYGAECIVHLNCGSAIDAARMGKTPISLEFLNTEILRQHAILPSRVSCHATSLDDLLSLLGDSSLRSTRYDLAGARREIEPWYHLSDGRAAERVADFLISRLAKIKRQARRSWGTTLRGGRPRTSLWRYLLGGLSLAAGSYMASRMVERLQSARRGKHIDHVAIEELILRFRQLDGGPELQVNRLRSPIAGQALSSFSISMS
jgi:surface carbohydrate biosynthesis protein